MKRFHLFSVLAVLLFCCTLSCKRTILYESDGKLYSIENRKARLEFDLAKGNYMLIDKELTLPVFTDAHLSFNEWKSTDSGYDKSCSIQKVNGAFGKGLRLDLRFESKDMPGCSFSFTLYEDQDFI